MFWIFATHRIAQRKVTAQKHNGKRYVVDGCEKSSCRKAFHPMGLVSAKNTAQGIQGSIFFRRRDED